MVCKRCGTELGEESVFCPKCGKRLAKKGRTSKAGMIVGISLAVVVLGTGIFLYMSGFYKNFLPVSGEDTGETLLAAETDAGEEGVLPETVDMPEAEAESSAPEPTATPAPTATPKPTATPAPTAGPSELQIYLSELTLEPVEMTMGETFLVKLEKEVPEGAWTSSDENTVQVSGGQLKAIAPGTAVVTLTAEGQEVLQEVTVREFSDMTLAVGCSATVEMHDAFPGVRWESSAPEVVAVSDGTVSSLQAGAAYITAYIGEVPYSFEVVATTPDITVTSVRKIIGNTQQVSILGTNGKAEWKSDNTAIATVSDTGLITAEPTGAGQSTKVHAYIDGMEFVIDVAVEPIPQLSSTYKIYGYNSEENSKATICTNANEILVPYWSEFSRRGIYGVTRWIDLRMTSKDVLNVADADYSDGMTYSLYRAYTGSGSQNYVEVYLVGTSQTADVLIQKIQPTKVNDVSNGILPEQFEKMIGGTFLYGGVTYEACEGYGIIRVDSLEGCSLHEYYLITISVDGYQYQFAVGSMGDRFSYSDIDTLDANFIVEECYIDDTVTVSNTDYSSVVADSRTYHSGNGWLERIGTKFVEEVEDQAIEMAVGLLFKAIFF